MNHESPIDTPMGEKKLEYEHVEGHASPSPAGHAAATGRNLGTLRGYDEAGKVILIPQPSDSLDDPLNWSKPFKIYIACLVCLAVLFCTLTGAGPSIAIVEQAIEFTGLPPNVAKTAYFFTSTALCNGVGLFLWVPAAEKWGRRPIYIICLVLYLGTLFWCAFAKSYAVMLSGRILLGFASGCGECLGALTITDIFFLHERGTYMALYNVFLGCGAVLGLILGGSITQRLGWRYMYYIDAALVGVLCILVWLTFPETAFPARRELMMSGHDGQQAIGGGNKTRVVGKTPTMLVGVKTTLITKEKYWLMAVKPLGVVFLPAVMYSTLVFAVTIGFLVAVTSNVAPAYHTAFHFTTEQVGFLFFGGLVGSLAGIPLGGHLGDWCAERFARANGGIREPEHRLPAMIPAIITGPLALVLYGLCIEKHLHWFVGCLGVSLINLTICAATNISLVYSIDCYKPIAGEVVTAQLGFKAIIGFVLGFYTNTWVAQQGYLNAYGQMAAISAFIMLLTVPMYFFGKRLRQSSLNWTLLKWAVTWSEDRDDVQVE